MVSGRSVSARPWLLRDTTLRLCSTPWTRWLRSFLETKHEAYRDQITFAALSHVAEYERNSPMLLPWTAKFHKNHVEWQESGRDILMMSRPPARGLFYKLSGQNESQLFFLSSNLTRILVLLPLLLCPIPIVNRAWQLKFHNILTCPIPINPIEMKCPQNAPKMGTEVPTRRCVCTCCRRLFLLARGCAFSAKRLSFSAWRPCFNPFTPKIDRIHPRILTRNKHHTIWRNWVFIAFSDERRLCYQFSLPHLYIYL